MGRADSLLVGEAEGGLGWAGRVGGTEAAERGSIGPWPGMGSGTGQSSAKHWESESRARQQPRGQAAMDKERARKCPGHGYAEGVVSKQMVNQGGWK